MGIVVLVNRFQNRYLSLIQRYMNTGALQLHTLENEEFQFTHADISGALLARWNFLQQFVDQILRHHRQKPGEALSRQENGLLRVIQIGELISSLSDLEHPIRRKALEHLLNDYTNVDNESIESCIVEAKAKKANACKLFSLPEPAKEILQNIFDRFSETSDLIGYMSELDK